MDMVAIKLLARSGVTKIVLKTKPDMVVQPSACVLDDQGGTLSRATDMASVGHYALYSMSASGGSLAI